jgi:ATP-dependent phosphoenolpyruvate carboxykinase
MKIRPKVLLIYSIITQAIYQLDLMKGLLQRSFVALHVQDFRLLHCSQVIDHKEVLTLEEKGSIT